MKDFTGTDKWCTEVLQPALDKKEVISGRKTEEQYLIIIPFQMKSKSYKNTLYYILV